MKYRNAADIFPDELLKEIQKYTSGETIYIPVESSRKQWGESSGARHFYQQRNAEIRHKYFIEKHKPAQLAVEYGLSEDTIKKIIYK